MYAPHIRINNTNLFVLWTFDDAMWDYGNIFGISKVLSGFLWSIIFKRKNNIELFIEYENITRKFYYL
jgi:hypothetical protein